MAHVAIETRGLTKRFGTTTALEDLDLEVHEGEIFGFLGPNGAGKSTTIRLLLSFIRPTRGSALIHGIPVGDVERAHTHVGYVPGDVALWPQLTGAETLTLLGNVSGRVDARFRDELIDRLQLDPSSRVRSYSKGNRQKVALVAALMSRPDVLLLDEPTAGLDPLMEAEFQDVMRQASARGQTVFLSSHILDEVQDLCDRVAILRRGRLVEVAAIDDLRRLGEVIVEVVVDGAPPVLDGLVGVTPWEPMPGVPGGFQVTVTGPPTEFLDRLAGAGILRLRTREPSLEEVFLTYYQDTSS